MSVTATAAVPSRPFGDAMASRLRETAIIVVGSGIAGALVGGIGSRVVMRISALAAPEVRGAVTENGNVVGEITLEGTIALMVLAGLLSTVLGAGAFVVARPWLPRRTVRRGLVFGGFLLALTGAAVVDKGNADFVILGDRLLNVTMFSALFLAFGLVASSAFALLGTPGAAGRVALASDVGAHRRVCAPDRAGADRSRVRVRVAARRAADRRLGRHVLRPPPSTDEDGTGSRS